MTAKMYLKQIEIMDQRINSKLAVLESLKAMATKTTSTISDMVVSKTRNNQAMEDTIVRIMEMQEQINRDIDRLVALKQEILGKIQEISDPRMQAILEMRYVCQKSWHEIADELHYCESKIFKLHRRALKEIKVPDFIENIQ